jgi:hypothetical protein
METLPLNEEPAGFCAGPWLLSNSAHAGNGQIRIAASEKNPNQIR